MIDTTKEKVLTFTEATRFIPRRGTKRRPVNVTTIYRWAQLGVRGIRLEWFCCGGTRCTSREALQRFFEALTVQAENKANADTAADRETDPAVANAENVLTTAGI